MAKEKEIVTPFTQRLLEDRLRDLREQEVAKGKERGEVTGSGGGDADHDEQAIRLSSEIDVIRRSIVDLNNALAGVLLATEPEDTRFVAAGHAVRLRFEGDSDDETVALVVTPLNMLVLADLRGTDGRKIFNRGDSILVSTECALGKAILGKEIGEKAFYDGNSVGREAQRQHSVDIVGIEVSKLLFPEE